jgi:hypothetical protein
VGLTGATPPPSSMLVRNLNWRWLDYSSLPDETTSIL